MTTKTLLTADEYLAMPEDGWSELVRGEVVPLPAPIPRHGVVCANVAFALELWGRDSEFGITCTNDSALQTGFDPDTVRGVDVVFISHDRIRDGVPVVKFDRPPNLCVEVISPSQSWTTVLAKVHEYLEAGVDEVWVVDPEGRWVERHTADTTSTRYQEGDEFRDCPALPGFTTPVAEFFRNA